MRISVARRLLGRLLGFEALRRQFPGAGTSQGRAKDHVEVLLASAVVGLAVFPLLGNAIALAAHVPRRISQIGTLFLFGAWAAYGWYRLFGYATVLRKLAIRRLKVAFVFSAVLVVVVVGWALAAGTRPSSYPVSAAILTVLWLTIASYILLDRSSIPNSSETFGGSATLGSFVLALVTALALVAYFLGPEPGDVYMAFRGSTIQVGTSAAILAAVALAVLERWYRFAVLVLAMYLSFLATSRTGLLLLIALCLIVLWVYSVDEKRTSRGLRRAVALLVMCTIVVVLPASFSLYYPYVSSRPGPAGARVLGERRLTDWEALVERYKRVLRLAIGSAPDIPISEILRLENEGRAEARWRVLAISLKAVATAPWGHWPQPFDQVTRIECGHDRFCTYPHNLELEIGYYFGWVPMLLIAVGLTAWSARVIKELTRSGLIARVTAIAFLGHLGFAQVSGNLLDHLLAMMFGLIWIATQTMSLQGARPDSV